MRRLVLLVLHLCVGNLNNSVANCGVSCSNCNNSLGNTNWNIGGRNSVTKRFFSVLHSALRRKFNSTTGLVGERTSRVYRKVYNFHETWS